MDMEDSELIQSFVSESQEMIDEVEPVLLGLQESEDDGSSSQHDSINAIFRLFHSIKGSAGFLKMENIAAVTHEAETLLDHFRRHALRLSPYYVEVQLKAVDTIREMLTQVVETNSDAGREQSRDATVLELKRAIALAANLSSQEAGAKPAAATPAPGAAPAAAPEEAPQEEGEFEVTPEMAERFAQETAEILDNAEQCLLDIESKSQEERDVLVAEAFRHVHSFKGNCGFMQLSDLERLSHRIESALDGMRDKRLEVSEQNVDIVLQIIDTLRGGLNAFTTSHVCSVDKCELILDFLDEMLVPTAAETRPAAAASPAAEPAVVLKSPAPTNETEDDEAAAARVDKAAGAGPAAAKKNIRVEVQKLDALINLVGELVIAEAMVLRNPALLHLDDELLERSIHQLRRISADLQDVAMSVRMVPLAPTFRKMIRLVHDISRRAGKKADICLLGEDTEVDKNVIEQINDPLVHSIRNAVDHGIESPEERKAKGKPEKGTVTVEAKHEGGEVWIIIGDDGKGLDRVKILRKAVERGMVEGNGADMSDGEVFNLIFEPGFSTADQITDISGRGVGMDVVKKNIEKLKGRVNIKSVKDKGTDIIFHIPLTLAIIDGMLVRVGDTQYTIPLLSIRESIRPDQEKITTTPDGQECILLRDELIPVLRLHLCYNKKTAVTGIRDGILVIVESDQRCIALLVDEILGQHQAVIKGLSSYLGNPNGVSGCTVLGDGEVSLIVDVPALVGTADRKSDIIN